MLVERRERVTESGSTWVNWQQEEPADLGGRRRPSTGGTSRVTGDGQARICERLGAKLPGPTRRRETGRRFGVSTRARPRLYNASSPRSLILTISLLWFNFRIARDSRRSSNECIGDFESTEEAFCGPDFRVTTWALCLDLPASIRRLPN